MPAAAPTADAIVLGDNLDVLASYPDGWFAMAYLDPPFNTGATQERRTLRTVADAGLAADRTGFGGRRYRSEQLARSSYRDSFDDYLGFLAPRLQETRRLLSPAGTLYFHIDYREAHYCKVLLDGIFGRRSFLNEIIWAYDYGARPTRRWPPKHDNILVYVKDPSRYVFDTEAVERIPYMAPGLCGPEKAARGKLPTDTWWHTIVPTNGRERTGYPTQKPLGIVTRIVQASSRPGDLVLDFFAGSGTTGEACLGNNRRFILVDDNPEALEVMARRFEGARGIRWVGFDPPVTRRAQRGAADPVAAMPRK